MVFYAQGKKKRRLRPHYFSKCISFFVRALSNFFASLISLRARDDILKTSTELSGICKFSEADFATCLWFFAIRVRLFLKNALIRSAGYGKKSRGNQWPQK